MSCANSKWTYHNDILKCIMCSEKVQLHSHCCDMTVFNSLLKEGKVRKIYGIKSIVLYMSRIHATCMDLVQQDSDNSGLDQ